MSDIIGAWTAGSSISVDQVVEPRGVTGFGYVCTVAGITGTSEPVWPLVAGATVVDNTVTWKAYVATTITWTAVPIYKTGTVEPVWPTSVGSTVSDGSITWTRKVQNIEDVNCPNSKEVQVMASKVYAIDGDVVRYSATNDPTDWTSSQDAGFLPVGLNAIGSGIATVLAPYRTNLAIWTASGLQVWAVDPDPAQITLYDSLEGLGSTWTDANTPVGNDLMFLTNLGVRSVSIAAASTNLQAGDLGSPIDPLIRELLKTDNNPLGFYVPGQGQYCLAFRQASTTIVAVLTLGKPITWSTYEYPFVINYVTTLDGSLYFRAGNDVYQVDDNYSSDNDVDVPATVEWNYLDFGSAGVTKKLTGFDIVGIGSANVQFGYDQRDRSMLTDPYTVDPDTVPGGIIAMPIAAPSLSVKLSYTGAFELYSMSLYLSDFRGTS